MTEIDQLIDRLFGGPKAVISEEDRQQALSVIQNRFGITPRFPCGRPCAGLVIAREEIGLVKRRLQAALSSGCSS